MKGHNKKAAPSWFNAAGVETGESQIIQSRALISMAQMGQQKRCSLALEKSWIPLKQGSIYTGPALCILNHQGRPDVNNGRARSICSASDDQSHPLRQQDPAVSSLHVLTRVYLPGGRRIKWINKWRECMFVSTSVCERRMYRLVCVRVSIIYRAQTTRARQTINLH